MRRGWQTISWFPQRLSTCENLSAFSGIVKSTSLLESFSFCLSRKHTAPGESSTPLVRSSERLAAKRRALDTGSLETLYFTPMMPRGKKRDCAFQEQKLESSITSLGQLALDSAKKQSSSVQRRRTTQVINITMTKVGLKEMLHSLLLYSNIIIIYQPVRYYCATN